MNTRQDPQQVYVYSVLGTFAVLMSLGAGSMEVPARTLEEVVTLLQTAPAGANLVAQAQIQWKTKTPSQIAEHLQWSDVSKTDALITRHWNPETGTEVREREVRIQLNRSLPLSEAVLDLAHEMTHALSQPRWDPYDPDLDASGYILGVLEAPGGEVDAVWTECQVSRELEAKGLVEFNRTRCARYTSGDEKGIRADIRRDFYQVGESLTELRKSLGEGAQDRLPLLSGAPVVLKSSTGHAPYPVALEREFQALNAVACENMKKRSEQGGARAPAQATLQTFLAKRCQI